MYIVVRSIVIAMFLLSLVFAEYNKYFILWGKNPEVSNAYSQNYVSIGNYLNSLPDSVQKYVIVNASGVPVPLPDGLPVSDQTTVFMERSVYAKTRATYLLPSDLTKIIPIGNTVIIPLQTDNDLLLKLSLLFPGGKAYQQNGFVVFSINNNQ